MRNINHKTKLSSMVAHPSSNNNVVGSNPRRSIFCAARLGFRNSIFFVAKSGLPQCGHFFRGQVGAASVRPAVALARPGWAWVRPRPTTASWDSAERGQGVAGRGRSQPLPPFVIFYIFSIFHCIYNMAMCCFFIFLGFFHF
jgi:hypothetical protein